MVVAAGDRLDLVPDFEPHTAWRQDDKPQAGRSARRPIRHRAGVEAWRGLVALLATAQSTGGRDSTSALIQQAADLQVNDMLELDYPLRALTVGVVYGTQSSIVEDVTTDRIPLPVAALTVDSPAHGLLMDLIAQAEGLRNAANRLGGDLRRALGGDKVPWDKGERIGDTLLHELSPTVRRLLVGLQREPDRVDEAEVAWRQTARQISLDHVEPALSSVPPAAFLGRPSERGGIQPSIAEARYRAAVRDILGVSGPGQSESVSSTTGV